MKLSLSLQQMSLAAAVLLLSACGGGSSPSSPSPTPSGTSVTVSGIAAKGPMYGALVSLFKVNADGSKGSLITTTTTSTTDGSYSATVTGYSGVVLAEVSVQAGTTMFDEATASTITAPTGLSLRASFPTVEGETKYNTQINVFTEMATSQAAAKTGGLSTANVTQTNSDMAAALSVNPLTTEPSFNKDTGLPTNAAGLVLAAVSKLAKDGGLGCTSQSQAEKVLCVVNTMRTEVAKSSGGIGINAADGKKSTVVDALQGAIATVSNTANLPTTVLKAAPTTGGTTTPVTDVAAGITQAKAFFRTLRSNIEALETTSDGGTTLKAQLDGFKTEIENATAPIASSVTRDFPILDAAVGWHHDMLQGIRPFSQRITFNDARTRGTYQTGNVSGGVSVCSALSSLVDGSGTLATSLADTNVIACAVGGSPQFSASCDYYTNSNDCSYRVWQSTFALTPDKTVADKYQVGSRVRYIPYIGGKPGTAVYSASTAFKSELIIVRESSTQQNSSVSWKGEIASSFRVNDRYTLNNGVYLESSPALLGEKHTIEMTSSKTVDSAGMETAAISGSIGLVQNGQVVSSLALLPGSYVQAKPDNADDYSARNGSQKALFKIKASTLNASFEGDFGMRNFKLNPTSNDYSPTVVEFTGIMSNANREFLRGKLTMEPLNFATRDYDLPVSTTNPTIDRVTFDGAISIENRPDLAVLLSFTVNDTGRGEKTDITGQYRQNTQDASQVINMSGTEIHTRYTSAPSTHQHLLAFETVGGLKFVKDSTKTVSALKLGSLTIGEVDFSNSKITYADNTYEQY